MLSDMVEQQREKKRITSREFMGAEDAEAEETADDLI